MKKILVPTDFSKHATYAAEVAAQIARITNAVVEVVHVVNLPNYEENVFSDFEDEGTAEGLLVMKLLNKKFEKLLKYKFWEGVTVKTRFEFESVYSKVVDIANDEDFDLIVAGSHGISGENDEFVGSNIDKIVRMAKIPVLTIKKRTENFVPRNIIFSSNFFTENKKILSAVKRIVEVYDANLHLLKVITPDSFEATEYSEKLISDMAEENGIEAYTLSVVNAFDVESGVYGYAKKVDAELICLATHGRKGWNRLFGKSIAEDLASHASEAVLTIKLNDKQRKQGVIFPD